MGLIAFRNEILSPGNGLLSSPLTPRLEYFAFPGVNRCRFANRIQLPSYELLNKCNTRHGIDNQCTADRF